MLAHEAGYSVLAYAMAAPTQRVVHPWTAISSTALRVHRGDLAGERFVLA